MRIGIIGAGLAGLTAARALAAAGHTIALYDKARGPGGRMSTRRVETTQGMAFFDHGAQYFNVRDPAFAQDVARWEALGAAARWPAAGDNAWVGTPGMNAIIKAQAADLDVRWNCRIEHIAHDGAGWQLTYADGADSFDAVLVAVPAEQVAPLLADIAPTWADCAAATLSQPCWTVMAAFAEPVGHGADCLRDTGAIGWAARNSAKPGRSGPESWVIQGSPAWSQAHLEDEADMVIAALMEALETAIGSALPPTLVVQAHRWRYALSGAAGQSVMWDSEAKLGVCGDWLIGPRIESAWASGRALAAAIVER
ncbi:NAD/FAD-dependent oxidoreductase [Blastomonas sp. AAP53]|uniref:NAD(P)/FAD-dependent oxidoreductase n=1 Tax=Blastomonas sp. AAP53 TaxID=1248760 RepID=UPI0002F8F4FC|nr:NAD/FAD-dependent oxidoreductase [Blastomonas sp. AAP53]